MFLNLFSCSIIVLVLIRYTAMLYIDGYYVILVMIVWPIIVYMYLIITSLLNRIKVNLIMKLFYMKMLGVLLGRLILVYILGILLQGMVILYILGNYIGYWMICIGVLRVVL